MGLDRLGNVVETGVLVVGGGISGLWAANRAREFAGDVLIVEKGPQIGFAGQAYFSGGGIEAVPPGANPEDHVKDAMYLADGLYEQDLLEKIFSQSWDRIEDFQRMGVRFIKNPDGSLRNIPQRGLKHLLCYLGEPFGCGGEDMMRALTGEAKRLGVRYMHRVYISDLLMSGDKVAGAVGFDTRSGEFYIFKAGAVVLTTGTCSMKGHYEDIVMSCGEGADLAYRAGARLKNMEFGTIWVIPRHFRWEGITYMLPLGAEFVDAKGKPFADNYSPTMRSNIDYNYLVRFMALEARKGNGPFFLDCSRMTPENKKLMEPHGGWTELQYKKLLEAGIRPFEERQEWCPGVWSIAGGVHSDLDMRTDVPGLFVAGKTRNIDPGIYFGGWSLCVAAATGRWAGQGAAEFAGDNSGGAIDLQEVKIHKKNLFSALENGGVDPDQVLLEVQKAVFPYEAIILKSEDRLRKALDRVEEINNELAPRMGARNVRQLMRLREARSIARMAELFLQASILRKETRASHYREDYPSRDDRNWLKWLMISNRDGKTVFQFEPLPLDRYKFKIDRFYMDNFKMPAPEEGC